MPVRIESAARLHLGLIDLHGGLGRKFGSLGVALERPRLIVEASPAPNLTVAGVDAGRAEQLARRFYAHYGLTPQAQLRILEAIPAHVGLGSGTQLALAVGAALTHLHGLEAQPAELAAAMGRGRRSGIGIGAFDQGGFMVDGGCKSDGSNSVSPVTFRSDLPPDWLFVVATPEAARGVSGTREDRAFDGLPSPSPQIAGRICRLLVMKMLPALAEQDIRGFGAALTEIQRLVGDSFAPAQGGRYATDLSTELVDYVLARGAGGAGQSSWGPTIYGLVQGEGAALALEEAVREFARGREEGPVTVFHSRASGRGARLKVTNSEEVFEYAR